MSGGLVTTSLDKNGEENSADAKDDQPRYTSAGNRDRVEASKDQRDATTADERVGLRMWERMWSGLGKGRAERTEHSPQINKIGQVHSREWGHATSTNEFHRLHQQQCP